jgi:hypothetical protein
MRTKDDLRQLQALPLELKIGLTKRRTRGNMNTVSVAGNTTKTAYGSRTSKGWAWVTFSTN